MNARGEQLEPNASTAPSARSADAGASSPRPKILIVDDRKENLVALRQVVKEVDAEVLDATSGNEALAATLDHDFALAIVDVQMPGMDGYELVELLRGDPRTRHLPVVFLTAAYGEEEQVFKGYEAGAVDYIVKPYHPPMLLSKVNVFLELHRKTTDLARKAEALRQNEEQLKGHVDRLTQLSRASARILACTSPDSLLETAAEGARELLGANLSTAGHGYRDGTFQIGGVSRAEGQPRPASEVFPLAASGVCEPLLNDQRTIRLDEAQVRARLGRRDLPDEHAPLRGLLGAALTGVDGGVSGLLMVSDKRDGSEFDEHDEALLAQLAAVTSLAMQHLEARQAAEVANEAKSAFLANMSHEIRTPMTAILGYAELLRARVGDPDARSCIQTIKNNGEYLCEIINEILDLSKIESGKLTVHREDCSIVDVLADVRSLMAVRAAEQGLTLSVDFQGEIPAAVHTDGKLFRQVLVNLVGNAVKFTERGGVQILARWIPEQEALEIAVSDTGIGIAPDHLEKLFRPFEQLDSSFTRTASGSGLGLAISRKIVEMLGGEITVESAPDEGSTFRFTIKTGPLEDADWLSPDPAMLEKKDSAEQSSDELPTIAGRVLTVDDRDEIRRLVRRFIEAAGGEVATAENGEQSLEQWRSSRNGGPPVDAVLMDVQMPGMDGLEATRKLRAEGYTGPIIALTANAMRRDRERCREAGCDDFLAKPLERSVLLEKLAAWLDERAKPSPVPEKPGRTVLFVDDHQAVRDIHKMLLEQHGHQVVLAASGEEALRTVESCTPEFALIDLSLKGMSGGELLSQLKTKPRLAGCVFVCHSGRTEEEAAWREKGFDHFLQKPAEPGDFDRVLQSAPPSDRSAEVVEPPVFDPNEGIRQCYGDEVMFQNMIDCFFEEAESTVAAARQALENRSPSPLYKASHYLKNTVAHLGAAPARSAAERLEALGRSGELTEGSTAVDQLAAEVERLTAALRQYRQEGRRFA